MNLLNKTDKKLYSRWKISKLMFTCFRNGKTVISAASYERYRDAIQSLDNIRLADEAYIFYTKPKT